MAVIGGGNSGVEAAIGLAGIADRVTLIEFDGRLRADDVLQTKLATLANVDVIDNRGQTSVPGVFAAGDCTTEPFKQIVVAMGAGSTAMLGAFDHLVRTSVSPTADSSAA